MFKNPEKLRSGIASVLLRRYLIPEQRRNTNMVVTGYPKSGTTWVSQLCAGYFGYQYERNKIRFRRQNSLLHTHSVRFAGSANLLYVVRDPREVICSAARTLPESRRREAFDEQGTIRQTFVRSVIEGFPGATSDMASHLQTCVERQWSFVRFEDLKADAVAAMTEFVEQTGGELDRARLAAVVQAYDFSSLKQSRSTDAFLAQSSLASWKELLDEESLDMLRRALGSIPERFGYDLD